MYRLKSFIFLLTYILLITCCAEPNSLPIQSREGTLQGQVYNLSHPGPIPIGWVPPPYEAVCTVIAEDIQQNIRLEVNTDSYGIFQIKVSPGTYYLRVKESRLSSVTGPYHAQNGETLEVKAYFDNGMR